MNGPHMIMVRGEVLTPDQYKEYCGRIAKLEDPDTVLKDIKARQAEAESGMFSWLIIIAVVVFVIGAVIA